jgi:hypothetical protein
MPSENESKILKMNPKIVVTIIEFRRNKMCLRDSLLKYLSHNSGKTQIGQVFTFFSVVHQNFGQINPHSLVRAHKQGFIGVMQGCHLQIYDIYTIYLTLIFNIKLHLNSEYIFFDILLDKCCKDK